jgi:hypothetical protein
MVNNGLTGVAALLVKMYRAIQEGDSREYITRIFWDIFFHPESEPAHITLAYELMLAGGVRPFGLRLVEIRSS